MPPAPLKRGSPAFASGSTTTDKPQHRKALARGGAEGVVEADATTGRGEDDDDDNNDENEAREVGGLVENPDAKEEEAEAEVTLVVPVSRWASPMV